MWSTAMSVRGLGLWCIIKKEETKVPGKKYPTMSMRISYHSWICTTFFVSLAAISIGVRGHIDGHLSLFLLDIRQTDSPRQWLANASAQSVMSPSMPSLLGNS